jgi:phage antirepressor YoqD-like protein
VTTEEDLKLHRIINKLKGDIIMKENELLEQKDLREKLKGRTEVLSKVKGLLLLPNTEVATTEQVAKYYDVEIEAIKSLVFDNKEEVCEDGYKVLEKEQLSSFKKLCHIQSRARNLAIFPQRAILRVGMLLRDSLIAKEIRTQLLNTLEHTTDEAKTIEIDAEKQLIMNVMFAKDDLSRAIAINEREKYNQRYKDKARYVDEAMNSETGISTSVIAKELGFKSATKLNKILAEHHIQYKNKQGQWLLYSEYAEKGYNAPYTYLDKKGNTHHATNWTEVGKKFIYDLVKKDSLEVC